MEKQSFEAGPWKIEVAKSHILRSKCENGLEQGCPQAPDGEPSSKRCNVCRSAQRSKIILLFYPV